MTTQKRLFDLVASVAGLVVLSPLLAATALAIKLDDRGPVFFRQVRVGLDGREFKIWKFRTMRVGSERLGGAITVGRDPRITRVGSVLRRLKLDELPQLVNVIQGDMSLVGPRPEVREYVDLYTSEQRQVLKVNPGITDPASIRYRNESELLGQELDPERVYRERIMPEKIRMNLEYAERASLWTDVQVILATVVPDRFRYPPRNRRDRRGESRD